MEDPKYMGIPNIQFSLTDKNDDRESEFRNQRIERGFDDSETWSLVDTICNFAIPRLERFIEISEKVTKDDQFHADCRKVLKGFQLIVRNDGSRIFNESEQNEVELALKIFPEVFMGMWW